MNADWFLGSGRPANTTPLPGSGVPPPTGTPNGSPSAPRTLHDLFPNFDFSSINSTTGGGSQAARQAFLDMMRQAGYNPDGTMGAYQLMGGNTGGGDNGGGTGDYYQGPNGELVPATDWASFQGQQGRWGSSGFLGQDRGDYNRYANDLGQLQYDPERGLFAAPGSMDFSEGSRYNTNFNHDTQIAAAIGIIGGGAAALGYGGEGALGADGLAADGVGVPASTAGSDTGLGLGSGVGGGGGLGGGVGADGLPIDGMGLPGEVPPPAGVPVNGSPFTEPPPLGSDGSVTTVTPPDSGSSLWNNLRTANSYRSGASFFNSLLNGQRGGNMSGLGDILALLGNLHNAGGNGIGTPNGALAAGQDAANRSDPFGSDNPGGQRGFYAAYLKQHFPDLISTDPAAIQRDPAYQFQLQSGTDAINRGAAAGGTLNSGNRLTDLAKYGQGLATNFTDKAFARNQAILGNLGTFSGATTGSPAMAGHNITDAFTGATTLRNNGLNGALSGNGLGSLLGLLGNGLSAGSDWLGNLFGGSDWMDQFALG